MPDNRTKIVRPAPGTAQSGQPQWTGRVKLPNGLSAETRAKYQAWIVDTGPSANGFTSVDYISNFFRDVGFEAVQFVEE